VTVKNVFWDINQVRTSQETHYVSATESIQLMLCKICGFHGNDYEECRRLGYKPSSYFTGDTLRFSYRVQPVKYYVRFEVFKAVTVKNVVFWDINQVCTSQETHYVSATESSQLMLCKI
jgi:hypothetical protein